MAYTWKNLFEKGLGEMLAEWLSSLDPSGVATTMTPITKLADNSGVDVGDVDVLSIAAGNNNIGDVDVASIAAGNNNIGDVDVASIAAGDNNIGNVDVLTIAAGDNNIGNVDVLSIAAGNNNIGDVDVASIAAGDNNIGNVDVLTIAAGDNNIGNVDIVTLPAVDLAATLTNAVLAVPTQIIKTIAAIATPEALAADGTFFRKATLIGLKAARTANVGNVYLGIGATNDTQPLQIAPSEVITITAPTGAKYDLNDWYLDVLNAGDGVAVIYA